MMRTLDTAVLRKLNLDPQETRIVSHGSSGFASTFKISTNDRNLFMKTGSTAQFKESAAGEHSSLNAIHEVVPTLCPASLAHGKLDDGSGYFVVTEFIDMNSGNDSGESLASKLARLHSTPAPIPKGYSKPQFGFAIPTFCGATRMENDFKSSWSTFFAENRLRGIARSCNASHGNDQELESWIEKTASTVVPRLLRDGHLGGTQPVEPVVVHGDLWSGNRTSGSISPRKTQEELIFDPSAFYAHSEYEIGIMKMFGGFSGSFMGEYHRKLPKTEPVEEYEDRIALYQCFHELNHYNLFGGGYRSQAVNTMKLLWRKYGETDPKNGPALS